MTALVLLTSAQEGLYQHTMQPAFEYARQTDIAVIKQGCGVEQNVEDQHCQCRDSQRDHDTELEPHRDHDLDGVKAQPCRRVELQIRMMHPMYTPEPGYGMKQSVLEIDGQVEYYQGCRHIEPRRHIDDV